MLLLPTAHDTDSSGQSNEGRVCLPMLTAEINELRTSAVAGCHVTPAHEVESNKSR
jgi:hypothetical protein